MFGWLLAVFSFVVAWAADVGNVMIFAEDAYECSLHLDGKEAGRLPLHAYEMAGGPHEFKVVCRDGRTAIVQRDVVLVPNGVARVELTGLQYSAATTTGP